jgi:uncharacterized protein (DUF1697 family)
MESITYIAFLRAINVGGRTVKMERLRDLFSELGFGNVRTYIQTGNVFFDTPETDRKAMTDRIEAHLKAALGYDVPTLVRTIPDVEHALALDPFRDVEVTPDVRLTVVFVSEPLPEGLELPYRSPKGDFEVVAATPGEVFLVQRRINGRPADPTAFFEKTSAGKGTSRFFHTTAKILEAAKKKAG